METTSHVMFESWLKSRHTTIALVVATCWLAAASPALAWDHAKAVCLPPICPACCCPDYVPKPWPCLPCKAPQCLCDDYCAKPLPGFCPVTSCLCDDYCKKPVVCLPGIPCLPWYKCEAPACFPSASKPLQK
jgi:hypothetical protein